MYTAFWFHRFKNLFSLISFVTATFMVEAMAAANALLRLQEKKLTVSCELMMLMNDLHCYW